MFRIILSLIYLSGLIAAAPTDHNQHVLDTSHESTTKPARKLQGRFLHITDIHPDPFYRPDTDPAGEHPCHKGDGQAGYFGAEKTECDSPFSLINATFNWIKENIKDEIDFIVWTGDSARHDNDPSYPRSIKQVQDLNIFAVEKFVQVFGTTGRRNSQNDFVIPIVPSFGNNDILPHNIFEPGPNRWTREYLSIWKSFVPEEQKHSFARGGWFVTEVIPNKLAVFSLNTLYFFDSNSAVDGCYDPSEPGYEHFEWLRIQLDLLRERNMKAILTGHVPPARTEGKQNWDETCYQKYTLWLRQYRDVIVGNLFGHMNIDHFMLQDVKELNYPFPIKGIDKAKSKARKLDNETGTHTMAKSDYLSDLRARWGDLPSPPKGKSSNTEDEIETMGKKTDKQLKKFLRNIGGPFAERFSLSLVAPSVVPNYYPSLRIIEYNITGIADQSSFFTAAESSQPYITNVEDLASDDDLETESAVSVSKNKRNKKKKKKGKSKPNFHVPKPPSKSSPPGPAYSPQTFTLLSWTQLYANLTEINAAIKQDLGHQISTVPTENIGDAHVQAMEKHFKYETEYTTGEHPYKLKDLTVRSWVELAEKIGRAKFDIAHGSEEVVDGVDTDMERTTETTVSKPLDYEQELSALKKDKKRKGESIKMNKMWHAFAKFAYVSTKSDEELEDEFG